MNRFFMLNPECILVKGALRGAIYDLKSGNVFSIDKTSVKILEKLSSGENLVKILRDGNMSQEKLVAYLDNLKSQGLGRWSDIYNKRDVLVSPEINTVLKYVLHLELTTGCNLNCIHCYNESEISKLNTQNELSVDEWKRIIREGFEIGCRRVQFIGGEPFLNKKLLYSLIPFARKMGYTSLEVSTNGTLITEKDLDFLKENGVDIAFSVYSYNNQTHDLITKRKGSYKKTFRAIQCALEKTIIVRASVVVMRQNEQETTETLNFLRSLGVQYLRSAAIEPSGRGCNIDLIDSEALNKQLRDKPHFAKINKNIFWRNKAGHNCFMEQICIGANGDVYPCLAEREISYGNAKSIELGKVFFSKLASKYKTLSKDNIETCRDCEYRYCCFDCRVRAFDLLESDFHPKPWWCSYNPYKGEWESREISLKGGEEKWKTAKS
jgi:radical SAM protein with 4Fe4S-binding SPASM domain